MLRSRFQNSLPAPNAGVLLGEDSAFQADGEGSNPFSRSNSHVVLSVVVCTSRCDRDSMSSILIEQPNFSIVNSAVEGDPYKIEVGGSNPSRCTNATLADVVIAVA